MSQALLQIPAAPSGLDLRVQTNQVFIALLTQNSGPTEPSVTYPGMWWGDTTANRLRRRTNADDAWKDIGPLDDILGDLRSQITALNTAVASAVPTGAVFQWDLPTAPTGYLLQNGAAVSRTTYAALFALYGTTFGAGDGSTTFNLPDKRGLFIRGHDAGRGIDPGRTLGSFQDQLLGSHGHGVNDPWHAHSTNEPQHAHLVRGGSIDTSSQFTGITNSTSNSVGGAHSSSLTYALTGSDGGTLIGYTLTGVGIYGATTGISIQATGGAENRPKNFSVNFIVKT